MWWESKGREKLPRGGFLLSDEGVRSLSSIRLLLQISSALY